MRWRRFCKRLLILLMFVCMTVKLHLEFRLLDATKSDNSFSPWWSNETLGHLRGFKKDKVLLRGNGPYILIGNQTVKVLGPVKGVPPTSALTHGKQNNITNKNVNPVVKLSSRSVSVFIKQHAKNNDTQTQRMSTRLSQKQHLSNQSYNHRKLSHETSDVKQTNITSQKNSDDGSEKRIKVLQPQVVKKPDTLTSFKKSRTAPRGPSRRLPKPAVKSNLAKKLNVVNKKGVSHDVDSQEVSLNQTEIERIQKRLRVLNDQQTINNEDIYGPILRNTTILLVQVHNRLENLRFLVESMKNTRGINDTLVVFSHDYWYPAMNDFVTSITEFRTMQMFFPFSIQLHPYVFPGRDPRDCSWNNKKTESLKCLNREWPDTYGHYREASFTQIKHHWWWKIHRVFNELRVTNESYTGHVVFLEEDHYILPDLLYVLSILKRERMVHCINCQILALGNYNKMSPSVYKNFVERGDWWVTKHNLGFALDRNAWKNISACKNQFCYFDDYNWDWTLNHIIQTCSKPRMSMLSLKFSRVLHVGSCGTHVKKKSCDVNKEVNAAKNRISSGKDWLFPRSLVYQNVYRGSGRVKKGNGGWGDFRDRQLCQAISNGTASEQTLKRLEFNHFVIH